MSGRDKWLYLKASREKNTPPFFLVLSSSGISTGAEYFLLYTFHRHEKILSIETSDSIWCVLLHNFQSIPGKSQNDTHCAQEFSVAGFVWLLGHSLFLPGTGTTENLQSIWQECGTPRSCCSLTPEPGSFWRNRTGSGHVTSVQGAEYDRSGSPGFHLWVERVWLSAEDVGTTLERIIVIHRAVKFSAEKPHSSLAPASVWSDAARSPNASEREVPLLVTSILPLKTLFVFSLSELPVPPSPYSTSTTIESLPLTNLFRIIKAVPWTWILTLLEELGNTDFLVQ